MKTTIIGLDLSFTSTGITITDLLKNEGDKMSFHKVVFDPEISMEHKYRPKDTMNLDVHTYAIPKSTNTMVLDSNDTNDIEQIHSTMRASSASTKIAEIIYQHLSEYKPDNVVICIENYIMPAFGGHNQLKNVGGLIMLQGFVRIKLINICNKLSIPIKLLTPTPRKVKAQFTGNGNDTKEKMVETFLDKYEGNKLLPEINKKDVTFINDVVDSFALMWFAYITMNKFIL